LFNIITTLQTRLKLPLHSIKHHTINTNGGAQTKFRGFLASTLDGVEWSVSGHGRFNSEEKKPDNVGIGG